eukprot:scaffold2699_cov98-Isochrysis_galbana.AAC.4
MVGRRCTAARSRAPSCTRRAGGALQGVPCRAHAPETTPRVTWGLAAPPRSSASARAGLAHPGAAAAPCPVGGAALCYPRLEEGAAGGEAVAEEEATEKPEAAAGAAAAAPKEELEAAMALQTGALLHRRQAPTLRRVLRWKIGVRATGSAMEASLASVAIPRCGKALLDRDSRGRSPAPLPPLALASSGPRTPARQAFSPCLHPGRRAPPCCER